MILSIVLTAVDVCRVDKTKCPVSAAVKANCIVSRSLISPTSITSGSSRRADLKALAKEMRAKRSSDVEKAGATAATKLLFPMMIFILPAVILVVASPLVFDFLR